MQKTYFRKDINGLRALAVLSVVIFHFNRDYLPGGFIGVDIFFVISGFLMTSIIFRGLLNNNFSYTQFLYSRVKRILPALMCIISILILFGFLFLEPMSYLSLGKHSFYSLLFSSNIVYWLESGYFDVNSNNKFLLHTWSLSVEWQFYMIYPLVLLVLNRLFSLHVVKFFCIVIFLISFILSLYFSFHTPSFSYFILTSRVWELVIGGLAFIYPIKYGNKLRYTLTILGLSLILISFFTINYETSWPGYMALLPVIGTYLCILSGKDSLFSLPPLQILGKYSYSIYLVHWPFLVILNIFNTRIGFFYYFIITFILSAILFNSIESKRTFGKKYTLYYSVLLIISYLVSLNGAGFRVPSQFQYSPSDYHNKFYGGTGYIGDGLPYNYNETNKNKFIISGDSFSRQYSNYLSHKNISLTTIFTDWCFSSDRYLSTQGDAHHKTVCSDRYNNFIIELDKNPTANVIYSQNWDAYILKNKSTGNIINSSELSGEIISEIVSKGGKERKYIIIGLPPKTKSYSYYQCMARKSLPINKLVTNTECPASFTANSNEINLALKNKLEANPNVIFIDPYDALCQNNKCRLIDDNGYPIYSDDAHLSIYGAELVGNKLLNKFLQ